MKLDKKYLGNEIRLLRQKSGYSQTEIAKEFNLVPQQLSNIERSVAPPPIRLYFKLCKKYGVGKEMAIKILLKSFELEVRRVA